MRRILSVVLIVLLCASLAGAQSAGSTRVAYPVRVGESKPLIELAKEMKPGTLHKQGPGNREVPNRLSAVDKPDESNAAPDAAWQRADGQFAAAAPTLVIEGLSSDDNAAAFGFRVAPPDVNGDVGPNHVVEMVNLLYRVWDKSGIPLIPPISTDLLWSGFGGNCEFNNDGDPIVFYDEINDRWVLSQFVFSTSQCIACSKTGDPTGAYWLYEYSTPGNDYPKMSNMPGAYYGTIRNFSSGFRMDAHAWNGAKIRAGDPTAEMIVRTMTGVSGIDGVQPADLDGPPPASSPGIFVGHQDSNNRLYLYQMVPNFANPGNTTFTGPTFISVPAYSSAFSVNVPQPGTTQRLDIIAPFTRFVTHFRDFGTHQTLIVNHAVDINDFSDHAGERWYELRKSGAGSWSLYQSGSYAPDAAHRWMGNAAMNGLGDIGLGYSVSSSSVNPSVRYTGRQASDPLGVMTMAEGVIAAGTGSQTGTGRWGDYSRITVDPADDETFWYFGEYVKTTGNYRWNTKIGAFTVTAGPPPSYTARINSGGAAYTTGGGVSFVADQAFTTGGFGYINGSTASYTTPIANTTDDPLYQTLRRRSFSNFQYDFTVPAGTYSVTLHMMSPATNWVMDVTAEGVLIYDNFDIDSQAGGTYTAVTRTFSTSVSDGRLDLTFTRVSGYAAVCAIEVVQTAAPSLTKSDQGNEAVAVAGAPQTFQLEQNYPNPFNPSTLIRYQIPKDMRVTLRIFNMLGEEVRTLVDRHHSAGSYDVQWDGRLSSGTRAPSGVYLYRLEGEGFSEARKMMLLQ
jgi:hypothetical protein